MSVLKIKNGNSWESLSSVGPTVHVGSSAPIDPNIDLWLSPDEQGQSTVTSVNGQSGVVTIDEVIGGSGYCKLPDGTLICYGVFEVLQASWSTPAASGSVYWTYCDPDVSFACPFNSVPCVSLTSGTQTLPVCKATATTTKIDYLAVWRHVSSKPPDGNFSYIAVGRWK